MQPRPDKAHTDTPHANQSAHTLQLLHANLLPASLRHRVGCSTSSLLGRVLHTLQSCRTAHAQGRSSC